MLFFRLLPAAAILSQDFLHRATAISAITSPGSEAGVNCAMGIQSQRCDACSGSPRRLCRLAMMVCAVKGAMP
jgi:hypothetical protein